MVIQDNTPVKDVLTHAMTCIKSRWDQSEKDIIKAFIEIILGGDSSHDVSSEDRITYEKSLTESLHNISVILEKKETNI